MKLLYLADRQALASFARSISGDRMVSMPHGPVLSQTLELANGEFESIAGGWEEWLCDRAGYQIGLKTGVDVNRDSLDRISDAEFAILNQVQDQFGHLHHYALRDYTHEHCPEWENPHGSMIPIRLERVLEVVGRSPEEIAAISRQAKEDRDLDRVFASL